MEIHAANIHSLIAAVIDRAIDDLKGIGPYCREKEKDRAMAFILSNRCEGWCLELGVDYKTIRETGAALYRREIENDPDGEGYRKAG